MPNPGREERTLPYALVGAIARAYGSADITEKITQAAVKMIKKAIQGRFAGLRSPRRWTCSHSWRKAPDERRSLRSRMAPRMPA